MANYDIDLRGKILGNRWKLGNVIGSGACGRVYDVTATSGEQPDFPVVIKVIPIGIGSSRTAKEQTTLANTLHQEYQILTNLKSRGFTHSPRLPRGFYGQQDTTYNVRWMVMEKFDRDLETFGKSRPLISEIAAIGVQMIEGLESIHNKGFLFIDIKPQNFMLKRDKLFFIDCKYSYKSSSRCFFFFLPILR